jgi:hypothetical protein
MMVGAKILPGTGRGTMRSMVEGPLRLGGGFDPTVSPPGCHLHIPGRI